MGTETCMRTLGEEPPEDSLPNPEGKKIMACVQVLSVLARTKALLLEHWKASFSVGVSTKSTNSWGKTLINTAQIYLQDWFSTRLLREQLLSFKNNACKWCVVGFGKGPSSFASWWFWYWVVSLVEWTRSVLSGVMLMRFLTLMWHLVATSDAQKSLDLVAAKVETVAFASVAPTRRIISSTVRCV